MQSHLSVHRLESFNSFQYVAIYFISSVLRLVLVEIYLSFSTRCHSYSPWSQPLLMSLSFSIWGANFVPISSSSLVHHLFSFVASLWLAICSHCIHSFSLSPPINHCLFVAISSWTFLHQFFFVTVISSPFFNNSLLQFFHYFFFLVFSLLSYSRHSFIAIFITVSSSPFSLQSHDPNFFGPNLHSGFLHCCMFVCGSFLPFVFYNFPIPISLLPISLSSLFCLV